MVILVTLALVAATSVDRAARPRVHVLKATPETVVWGYYDAASPPVFRIASGDIIEVDTLLTNTPAGLERAGLPAEQVQPSLRDITTKVNGRGHILTGPVFVEGAEPGDALEVRVLAITLPIAYGYNGCSGFLRENCSPAPNTKILQLDRKAMTATLAPGIVVPLKPFFGSMGVAPPPEAGRVSSTPPGTHAGNLDNKELVAGTTLFIPVHVTGALFQIGDGHAAQGDGEVNQTAIETSLHGRVQLTVRKDLHLTWPRAETPEAFIAMGIDRDLTQATKIAVQEAIDFLAATRGLSKTDAYRLVSIACSVRITQLVDQTLGVHVMIPKSIFKRNP